MSCTRTTYSFTVEGDNLPDLQMRAGNQIRELFGHDKDYQLDVRINSQRKSKYVASVHVL